MQTFECVLGINTSGILKLAISNEYFQRKYLSNSKVLILKSMPLLKSDRVDMLS